MELEFLSLKNKQNLIDGVKLHQLKINRDSRGLLVETLKENWEDVFRRPEMQFGQSYCSVTLPGFARDEDKLHNHPTKQTDRFVVIQGSAVFALYDWREGSSTHGKLNLFLMGETNEDDNQYLLLIPQNVLHGFCTVGEKPCYLLGFPNQTYDPSEEGRIPLTDVAINFPDGSQFSWQVIRDQFKGK